jgi:hypothetical protein
MNILTKSILLTVLALCSGSCFTRPKQEAEPPASIPVAQLATPIADSPAAGICAEQEGSLVTVTIFPDIPDPRCSFVRPEQQLRVINMRSETLKVSLAGLEAEIAPGEEHVFEEPFGALLMPGVHRFDVLPCCGAELVLRPNP